MNDIQVKTTPFLPRAERRSELESGSEDGFSLSRRSVLTEKLVPARWAPPPRRRVPQGKTPVSR
jgi:hypothetical protein